MKILISFQYDLFSILSNNFQIWFWILFLAFISWSLTVWYISVLVFVVNYPRLISPECLDGKILAESLAFEKLFFQFLWAFQHMILKLRHFVLDYFSIKSCHMSIYILFLQKIIVCAGVCIFACLYVLRSVIIAQILILTEC